MGTSIENNEHFLPRGFRWYTVAVLVVLSGLGVVTAIAGLWNFLLLAVGEVVLYAVYQRTWHRIRRGQDRAVRQPGTGTFSFGRYVFMTWAYAMLMEFCVDFGAYNTLNPLVVLVIMLVLTPHYFFLAAVFRLWFRWFTYSPREAYFTLGAVGFLLESIILKFIAGTFAPSDIVLSPVALPVHMLNYGGVVLIPTLYHNRTDRREPTRTRWKYAVGIAGTLALTLPEIGITYAVVYRLTGPFK
ncbi:MAG TPA: hypothetical protein ENN87_04205 [Phycisphaerales bacterium]|nr:hypothetical protein [Phycisphaerales bacterium]